jgi:SAM-dependent methyltransferase
VGDPAVRSAERQRWDTAVAPLLESPAEALWRLHSDGVNAALVERWLPIGPCAALLKTDLYDEAMGAGLYPLLAMRARCVAGVDVARTVILAAVARYPNLSAIAADVRELPFAQESFDVVVSNSTLDHFATREEIRASLAGLFRVLRRGGRLLLTLDNLANPAVMLRNLLPFELLRRLRLVPYPVGATYGPRRLVRLLRQEGFEVLDRVATLHCPRVLAIPLARRIQRADGARSRTQFLRRLERWESLARLPTRYLTGYFVAIHARRP